MEKEGGGKGKKSFFNFFLTNQAKETLFIMSALSNMLWKMTGIKAMQSLMENEMGVRWKRRKGEEQVQHNKHINYIMFLPTQFGC